MHFQIHARQVYVARSGSPVSMPTELLQRFANFLGVTTDELLNDRRRSIRAVVTIPEAVELKEKYGVQAHIVDKVSEDPHHSLYTVCFTGASEHIKELEKELGNG